MYPYMAPNQNIKKQGPTWLRNVFDKRYGVCLNCLIAEEKQTSLEPKFKPSTSSVNYLKKKKNKHAGLCVYSSG